MDLTQIIPMVGQLLTLGFKLAEIIDRAETVTPEDKEALKEAIKKAQSGVTYWVDEPTDGPLSEDGPVLDNG